MKTKTIIILIFLIVSVGVFGQDSLYQKKIDTLYIIYENPKVNKYIINEYTNIKSNRDKSILGLNSIYFLLDSILVNKRNAFYDRFEESIKKGNASGATSTCDWCFGLYFIHKSIQRKTTIKEFKNSSLFKIMSRRFFNKDSIVIDSIGYDKFVFSSYRRLFPPSSRLQLSEKKLKEKNVFYFDGSTLKYNELKELLKEPHYLFMLDSKWVKQELNSNYNKVNYYIFNEVMYRPRTRSSYPELREN